MFYLWKDKTSKNGHVVMYMTDYHEINAEGKVRIDNYGYIDVELVHSAQTKPELISFAQNMGSENTSTDA